MPWWSAGHSNFDYWSEAPESRLTDTPILGFPAHV